jgi:hypothetical protein
MTLQNNHVKRGVWDIMLKDTLPSLEHEAGDPPLRIYKQGLCVGVLIVELEFFQKLCCFHVVLFRK